MVLEQQLRVPGPTPLPQRVIRSASRPMINHRGPEFAAVLTDVIDGLHWALRTQDDVLIFPASGTGGMEAAVVNLLSPGEKALFCTMGAFGDRWVAIGETYGANVVKLAVPMGEAIDPAAVEAHLAEHPDVNVVFITHNETSTGVTNDIAAVAAIVKNHGKLLAVDSVSGAGCLPLEVGKLGIDVLITGSQKGWMAPPGVVMVAVSPSALEKGQTATLPRFYFDFAKEKSNQDKLQTFTTPAVSVLYALQEGLAIMREEGLEETWARHSRIGEMVRAGIDAIGLRLLAADGHRSNTVTAVHNPAASPDELKDLLKTLRTRHGLVLAGGQGDLQGKIFRIGHLGAVDERDVYAILGTLEQALVDAGLQSRAGLAVAAAQSVVRQSSGDREPAPVG